jgi:hypothetical protein
MGCNPAVGGSPGPRQGKATRRRPYAARGHHSWAMGDPLGKGTMAVALCQGEGVVEYFKGLVDEAMDHQHVDAQEITSWYVVQLLSSFARADALRNHETALSDQPLAIRLAQALETGGARQRVLLRQVGDASLFLSGFFPDRLKRSLVDVDYYARVGGIAYGSLGQRGDDTLAPVFAELAEQFLAFVDVLSEVSERSSLTNPTDLLRLYERWLRTGSPRCGQLLMERGVVPTQSASTRFVQ